MFVSPPPEFQNTTEHSAFPKAPDRDILGFLLINNHETGAPRDALGD